MLRTAKTTGILLTALLLSLLYLFVFFLSYFENSCYLSYFWQTIFGFIYVCTCIYGLHFCPYFLLHTRVMPLILSYCSVNLPSETSVGVMLSDLLWAVSPISSYRQYYWNFPTGYEDFAILLGR